VEKINLHTEDSGDLFMCHLVENGRSSRNGSSRWVDDDDDDDELFEYEVSNT
jgi:hypothetical protein